MKGDFTRLTFQPDKHYTSVRMQQGRLQLDSDWNEQADIQAHLYRTQVVDLIGAESGVPTSGNDLNQPYKDSFKISVTSDNTDLVIAHGHFYVNGTLCELEETRVGFKISSPPSNRIQAASLIVDGRKFAKGQWLKIVDSPSILQINGDINTQTLELPLNALVTTGGEIHRVATYKTQSDYPNPESFENGLLLAYLDVWQRHITTAEDPSLREVALNIPDTTTRSKTVWQLKLQPLNRKFITDNQGAADLLQKLDDLSIEALKKSFDAFLTDKIALSQQQVAKGKFNELLPKVLHPVNDSSWQEDFSDLLESLFSQENSDLKSSFSSLLNEVVSTDLEQQQIYQSFGGLLIGDTEPKQSFEIVLAKIAPAQTEKEVLKQAFGSLLADTISTQKEKATLQQLFADLLKKVILSLDKKMVFQTNFDTLIANATAATPVEKQTWTNAFSSLLLKIDQLNLKGNIFQLAFASLLDKAIASDRVLKEIESYEKDETIAGDLKSPEWSSLIKDSWNIFNRRSKDRKPSMNACAKQCPVSGNMTTNSTGYRRLQNQLYRVEIHQPGQVIDGQPENASSQKATFKWSRDNGSIVSIIENSQDIQKGIITIRVSAQDAWSSSKTGQWIELLDEERELKGLPGQLARLNRVSGNKIEFDASSLDGNSLQAPTKVRRWDHITKESSIFTRTEWVELEDGIKVQFNKNSEYKTGDYWLIPARASTNDIEWPNDQSQDVKKRQPLSQPALGVHHDYCLLASVEVKSKNFLPLTEEQDYRFVFPALAFAFDRRGGVIEKDLEVKGTIKTNNFSVTGKFSAKKFQGEEFKIVGTGDTETDNPTTYGTIKLNNNNIEFNAVPLSVNFKFPNLLGDSLTLGSGASITSFSTSFTGNSNTVVPTEQAVKQYVDPLLNDKANIAGNINQDFSADELTGKSLTLSGVNITNFLTSLIGNSNTAVPTEQAVKQYVDPLLNDKANIAGNINQDFSADELTGKSLTLSGVNITSFLTSLTGNSNTAVPTEQAVKQYVDPLLNDKANIAGNINQSFQANELKAKKLFAQNVVAPIVQSGSFTQISSRLLKEQIVDLSSKEAASALKSLNPVTFVYIADETKHLHAGFIAEDTACLLTSPNKQAVKIMDVVAILTKTVQDQQKLSEELSSIVKNQHNELEILREKVKVLEKHTINSSSSFSFAELPEEPAIQHSSRIAGRNRMALRVNLKHFIRHLLGGMRRRSS
jgi:Family of unknown function (DUF6519)/Chaperone of endosialidase